MTGAIDEPNERKVHSGLVPRMGGLAMYLGFLLTYLIYFQDYGEYRGIFLGMLIIVFIGLIDDSLGLDPKLKLLGQMVAALAAMVLSDVNIDFFGGVIGSNYSLGMLAWPLTLFWIVGITNAINLSDGLDGLASGISLIAFSCFGLLAYQRHDIAMFCLCLALVGCILGFLKYNTHPAEIFMGDTGSLFLGYSLGTLSIAGNFKSLTTMTLITPILVLLVPIADTLWAIIRRLREGRSPFSADKKHFHHKLLGRGMDQSQTVSAIYGTTAALSISAVALANSSSLKFLLVPMLGLGVALFFGQVFGLINLSRLTKSLARQIDRIMPHRITPWWSKAALRLIYLGVALYLLTFLLGVPMMPFNLLFVVTTTVLLVFFLIVTRGPNGQSFTIFSLFFLAASVVLVVYQLQDHPQQPYGPTISFLDTLAMAFLSIGVVAKIIFKKKREIFLTTPLEFFIFLVVVSIAIIPEPIRAEYNLVGNTVRTFLLFLAFKIMVLTSINKEESKLAFIVSSMMLVFFTILF